MEHGSKIIAVPVKCENDISIATYRILNIGSGARPIKGVINIDIPQEEAAEHHRDKPPVGYPDIEESVYTMKCPDETYDAVMLIHTLEHFKYPGIAMDKIWRVLKPEGRLLIELPNAKVVPRDRREHLYSWTKVTIRNMLREWGFSRYARPSPLLPGLRTDALQMWNPGRKKWGSFPKLGPWNMRVLGKKESVCNLV